MTLVQKFLSGLWWGPSRRLFRSFIHRTIGRSNRIFLGPAKGFMISSGPVHKLGIYEYHLQSEIIKYLDVGNVFYDIGANVGYFCLIGSKQVGDTGQVYAFEPLPQNIARL